MAVCTVIVFPVSERGGLQSKCNHICRPGNWKSMFESQVSGNWVFFRLLPIICCWQPNKIEAGDEEVDESSSELIFFFFLKFHNNIKKMFFLHIQKCECFY